MPSRIDHIIIGVRDLAQASADYAAVGFTVTPGGEHTGGGTHNALISFADTSYLELIAYRDPATPRADDAWWQRLARGEGFLGFALRMEDAAAEAATLQARGGLLRGPFEGGRDRPDGQHVAWRSIVPEGAGPLPFLISPSGRTPSSCWRLRGRRPRPVAPCGCAARRHTNCCSAVEGRTRCCPWRRRMERASVLSARSHS